MFSFSLVAHAQEPSTRSRLLILTDIEADPYDTQSLVRLLLYSNEIYLEGLVAATSIHMQSEIHLDSIRAVINAYSQVRANLLKHAPGYPGAADVQKLVVEGQPAYGTASVGKGMDTAGSQLIPRALEAADPRPVGHGLGWSQHTGAGAILAGRGTRRRRGKQASRQTARLHDLRPGRQRRLDAPRVSDTLLYSEPGRVRRRYMDGHTPGGVGAWV